jgi:hypothetical protein
MGGSRAARNTPDLQAGSAAPPLVDRPGCGTNPGRAGGERFDRPASEPYGTKLAPRIAPRTTMRHSGVDCFIGNLE